MCQMSQHNPTPYRICTALSIISDNMHPSYSRKRVSAFGAAPGHRIQAHPICQHGQISKETGFPNRLPLVREWGRAGSRHSRCKGEGGGKAMEQGLGGPRASLRIPPLVIAAVRFGWDQELGAPAGQTPPWQDCLGIGIDW